jgi:hypothetical protein
MLRLIELMSPRIQRERSGTSVGFLVTEVTNDTPAHQAPSAPYVTSSAKETPETNYKVVIETGVIEW